MILNSLKSEIAEIVRKTYPQIENLGRFGVDFTSDSKFGDISTNAAMVYAKDLGEKPREVAGHLAKAIEDGLKGASRVEVAGPGFINITLSDAALAEMAVSAPDAKPAHYKGEVVVTEYSDPNPFKVLHAGHLYTSVVGDAVTNLIRLAGGKVHPVNFGGDVGLHVAKTMWAILRALDGEHHDELAKVPKDERSVWMAQQYVEGERAYGSDASTKTEIDTLNVAIYAIHERGDRDSDLAKIYWTCRQWSYDYFDEFYTRLGTKFEKYYPESETVSLGLKAVNEQLEKGVYTKSDGAVVFDGEPYGLHTRVFITSRGLPTYEAKDVGLILAKWRDYHFDRSVVITGNDIVEYMKVVLKSVEQYEPELAVRTMHITHGNVKLAGGVKMSSRLGNVLTAMDILNAAAAANKRANEKDDERVVLGAVKYAFLKSRIGLDLVYVPDESVSLEGNSGPYLQYAHARACSVLAKATGKPGKLDGLEPGERTLARKLIEYPHVLDQAVRELMPHHISTYLYELAQVFNRFYEKNRVIGDAREGARLQLVQTYQRVLKGGLEVLGIEAPARL